MGLDFFWHSFGEFMENVINVELSMSLPLPTKNKDVQLYGLNCFLSQTSDLAAVNNFRLLFCLPSHEYLVHWVILRSRSLLSDIRLINLFPLTNYMILVTCLEFESF